MKKQVSVFIDESGQYSMNEETSDYYIITLVFHDQTKDISDNISRLNNVLRQLGLPDDHTVHTGPLIRRKFDYAYMNMEWRKKIFNALFTFSRHIDITYATIATEKKQSVDDVRFNAKLSKLIYGFLNENISAFAEYDETIVYYDGGQKELTRLISSAFGSILGNVDFRKIEPVSYKLAQVADLCCTLELIALKADTKTVTKSELYFFESIKKFRKSYLSAMRKKAFQGTLS
ncbi:MAG: DUF3800 domain-containing protein [Clostridiales Family XIII bacterium]|nr:DUF3800 domain-containing protein [Clostridiales Family XIII bacterium]